MTKPKTQTKAKAMAAKAKALAPTQKAKPAPQTAAARVEVVPLASLHNDPHNVNKHTQEGQRLVEQSIRQRGVARPGFAARNAAGELVMLGGNLSSLEVPAGMGMDEAVLVFTDGKRPIIHVRQDLDAGSDTAKLLALEDNVSGVASYDPDIAMLAEMTEIEGFDEIISESQYRQLLAAAVIEANGQDENYSRKIEAPIYKPMGPKPATSALFDDSATRKKLAEIDAASDIPDDVRAFLHVAAQRHTVINYKHVAEFYAQSSAQVQRLFENSGLVIIDFNRAIELGFVTLTERMREIVALEEGNDD